VTIRIDAATKDDVADILASAEALVAMDAGVHDAAATNRDWGRQNGIAYCTSLLDSDDTVVLLARDGDQVVGHLVGRLYGPGSLHPVLMADLESIHVYPGHRGRGVGEQFMTAFLAWAREKAAARVTVTAYAANEGARRFYARHGFAVRSVTMDRAVIPGGLPGQ
jgi:GNAT superfamily N-acetyltransferase